MSNFLFLGLRARVRMMAALVAAGCVCMTSCKGKPDVDDPSTQDSISGGAATIYETIVEMSADVVLGNEYARGPQRVHLGPDNTADHSIVTEIRWTEGDEVACWNAEEKLWAPYVLTSGADCTSARFQGKAVQKDDNDGGLSHPALNISHAIFPLSATVQTEGTNGRPMLISPGHFIHSIYFTMPDEQIYQAPIGGNPTFGTQYNVMTGTRSPSDPSHVLFRSTGGVLLLRIKGSSMLSSLSALKITSNKDEKLWGTFSAAIGVGGEATVDEALDINGATLASLGLSAGTNSLILNCREAFGAAGSLPKDKFTNFYFVVPYGVFSQGFTITMDTDGNGEYNDGTITTTKDNTIIQSDIKVMPALELTENVTLTWDLDDLYEQGTVTEF